MFDISQTEGEPLPQAPAAARIRGQLEPSVLEECVKSCPYKVGFAQMEPQRYGYTDGRAIVINADHRPAEQLYTLFHEWTHAAYHFGPERLGWGWSGSRS